MRTQNTQPALLYSALSPRRRLLRQGAWLVPSLCAGHSLANIRRWWWRRACASPMRCGLVHLRGRFMQEAVAEGRWARWRR